MFYLSNLIPNICIGHDEDIEALVPIIKDCFRENLESNLIMIKKYEKLGRFTNPFSFDRKLLPKPDVDWSYIFSQGKHLLNRKLVLIHV